MSTSKGRATHPIFTIKRVGVLLILASLLLALVPTQAVGASPGQLSGCTALMSQRLGSRGPCVIYLQEALNLYGYNLNPDGVFGPLTDKAVRAFQSSHHLQPVDGIVGPQTRAALLTPPAAPPAAPPPVGPNFNYECDSVWTGFTRVPTGSCSYYISRHTTKLIQKTITDFESKHSCSLLNTSCGELGEVLADAGACIKAKATPAVLGCGVLVAIFRGWGKGQLDKAAAHSACIRIRMVAFVPTGLLVVHRDSDGAQYCKD